MFCLGVVPYLTQCLFFTVISCLDDATTNVWNFTILQKKFKQSRYEAHKSPQNEENWNKFRSIRNQLKKVIKKAKTVFVEKALLSKRPKDVWKTIHRILYPSPQPLRIDPNQLNKHFASTAERVVASSPLERDDLYSLLASLPQDSNSPFQFRHVTYREVLNEIKHLRSDCSTGPDNIPCKFIKLVANHLASPVTHIINNCIAKQIFPLLWKTARISPIPKVDDPRENDDYRPISILCVLSKVYERLALRQMADFLGNNAIFNPNNSAYRRGHSTTTTMLAIRDDILRAMKRGEVTVAVLADFLKAFDTVVYQTVLSKLHRLGFSKTSLKWIISYLTDRIQYVQVDDRSYTSMIYLTCCLEKLLVISMRMILLSTVTVSHLIYNNVNRNCNVHSITCLLGLKNVTLH